MQNQSQALEKSKVNTLININMDDLMSVSDLIFKSGVYGDVQSAAQAGIKVLAGKEKGFDPFQSQSMFDFIQKRTVLNAHGKATLINSSGDYRLHTKDLTPKLSVIDVLRKDSEGKWKVIATRTFSWEDAVDAGYTTGANAHSYKKTPRNMLFSRNVSNIWRWDTAELEMRKFNPSDIKEFNTPFELLAEINPDSVDGEVVEELGIVAAEPINDTQDYGEPVTDEEAEFSGTEIDPEEKTLVDLRIAVGDLLNDNFRDDPAGLKSILKGREVAMLDAAKLAKLHNDLLCL